MSSVVSGGGVVVTLRIATRRSVVPAYKNEFARPEYYDHEIVDTDGHKVGTIRVKPVSVLWKPVGAQDFYAATLEAFAAWIMEKDKRKSR